MHEHSLQHIKTPLPFQITNRRFLGVITCIRLTYRVCQEHHQSLFAFWGFDGVIECLLFNAKRAILQPYYGENKLLLLLFL